MNHQMKLAQEPFAKIKKGSKIIESRLFDGKRQQINIGDFIEFKQSNDLTKIILTKVKALYRYPTFNELFSDFPASYFGDNSKEKLLNETHQFYSLEEEKKFGVIGIKFELANKKEYSV